MSRSGNVSASGSAVAAVAGLDGPGRRRRGRPVTAVGAGRRLLELAEVAEITGVPVEVLGRLLDRAPGALPGAVRAAAGAEGGDGWRVPEAALRALLGARTGPLPQYATVADVAEALRVSVHAVYRWLRVRLADGTPMLAHREILGQKLIRADDVLRLPARMPGGPFSFFAGKEGGHEV